MPTGPWSNVVAVANVTVAPLDSRNVPEVKGVALIVAEPPEEGVFVRTVPFGDVPPVDPPPPPPAKEKILPVVLPERTVVDPPSALKLG